MAKQKKTYFCPDCDLEICDCVIDRIRKQENAIIQAGDALKSLEALNNKLTKEKNITLEELAKWKEKAQRREQSELDKKMKDIDERFGKIHNRDKLI